MSVPDRTFHCELAWLGDGQAARDVLIDIVGERIVSVRAGVPAPPGAERLRGLTLPGLANAHSHAFHRALRGRTERGTGSFWTWREQMYALAAALDPDEYHRLARAVYGEMALAGITCVGEFHYLHHDRRGRRYADPNAMSAALVAAAADAGIRITLLDTLYLHGGIGVEPTDLQRRFSDGDVESWASRSEPATTLESPLARVGVAIHSVRAVDPGSISAAAAVADQRGVALHAHVSEQPDENAQCVAAYGRTPTALLADCGALSPRFTAVHATHVSDDDVTELGASAVTACLCPTTERHLADGIGPAARLVAAGARLSLGTDSHALVDPFEEMRAVELGERVVTHQRGNLTTVALLRAASVDGFRCLGWPESGSLTPGALADLVTLRLDGVRLAGIDAEHALDAAVFAASPGDVERVVVGGRTIVSAGRHCSLDVTAELTASIRAAVERAER